MIIFLWFIHQINNLFNTDPGQFHYHIESEEDLMFMNSLLLIY